MYVVPELRGQRIAGFVHILAFGGDVDLTPITKQLMSAPHR